MRIMNSNEKGFGYIVVFLILIIVCASIVAVSSGYRTQTNIYALSNNTAVALAEAEKGIALGFEGLKAGNTFTMFTVYDSSWKIDVTYTSTSTPQTLKAVASLGRYSRTVQVEIVSGTNPLLQYDFVSGGTMSLTNGNFVLANNKLFANGNITASSCNMQNGTLSSHATVSTTNGNFSAVTSINSAPLITIPDVNWTYFTTHATTTINISANTDISSTVLSAASGSTIVVHVTNGSPTITIGSNNYNNINVTLVVVKDSTSSVPTLNIGNGNYTNCTINAFVDGKITVSSANFINKGSFYATNDITLTSGNFAITGGCTSKTSIVSTSVNFGVSASRWADWNNAFVLGGYTKSNWDEL